MIGTRKLLAIDWAYIYGIEIAELALALIYFSRGKEKTKAKVLSLKSNSKRGWG